MLQRLYKITFNDYNQIDLDLFTEISDFLSGRQDGSYGEILYPTKDHFTKKKVFGLTNKILLAYMQTTTPQHRDCPLILLVF